jgi:hypothetical protein
MARRRIRRRNGCESCEGIQHAREQQRGPIDQLIAVRRRELMLLLPELGRDAQLQPDPRRAPISKRQAGFDVPRRDRLAEVMRERELQLPRCLRAHAISAPFELCIERRRTDRYDEGQQRREHDPSSLPRTPLEIDSQSLDMPTSAVEPRSP